MKYQARIGDQVYEVDIEDRDNVAYIRFDGEEHVADLHYVPGQERYSLILDGRSLEIFVEDRGEKLRIYIEGNPYDVEAEDARVAALRSLTSRSRSEETTLAVRAPMPGLLIVMELEPGQTVAAGQTLCVIEAMKMHNEVRAPRDGVIDTVRVTVGQRVEKDQVLLTLR